MVNTRFVLCSGIFLSSYLFYSHFFIFSFSLSFFLHRFLCNVRISTRYCLAGRARRQEDIFAEREKRKREKEKEKEKKRQREKEKRREEKRREREKTQRKSADEKLTAGKRFSFVIYNYK